jgi:hypothetical protein
MTKRHPVTPPPELVKQWIENCHRSKVEYTEIYSFLATCAAQWGADQELVACGNYLKQCAAWEEEDVIELYNYRRPKPPSLKEQALEMLENAWEGGHINNNAAQTIRRALEGE